MVKLIFKKIEGSTLIEVLIAMVIIVVVFTIAMQIFYNVISTSVSTTKIKADSQMRYIADQVKQHGKVDENTMTLDSISYEMKVVEMENSDMAGLEISATQNGKNVSTYRCLFLRSANHEN